MLMFRFWASDSRGSDKSVQLDQPIFDLGKSAVQPFVSETSVTTPPRPLKRRRPSHAAIASPSVAVAATASPVKRPRVDDDAQATKGVVQADMGCGNVARTTLKTASMDRAREAIEVQFSQEILFKHQELRLINQELAKCQVALEQLRRCHLIPYPVNVPTPDQMLNIASGQGPALQARLGAQIPQWAAPFGVTDGPYARHLAKWLIPDPKFDGMSVPPAYAESARSRNLAADGRSMRNAINEVGSPQVKSRRSTAGQKLQSLPAGYAHPKGKAGPCVLKRADGKTVKLVCIKCHREDFSSTQGFINHCRIAHKIEYKSHEEAAVACGHPIDVDEAGGLVGEERPIISQAVGSVPVHPLTREDSSIGAEYFHSVARRIEETMAEYRKNPSQGSIPGVTRQQVPTAKKAARQSPNFKPSTQTPNLSNLVKLRGNNLDLAELVRQATESVNLDVMLSPDEESDESETELMLAGATNGDHTSAAMGGIRMPARKPMSPVPPPILPLSMRPTSSKCRSSPAPYATPVPTPAPRLSDHSPVEPPLDDEMDIDLSPNTAASNIAPSLVSDDDEYDDSVDGSSDESEANDAIDTESMTDVAEIHFDDEGPRALRHHRGSAGTGADPMQLRKEENKNVTFITPVRESPRPSTPVSGALKRKNRI